MQADLGLQSSMLLSRKDVIQRGLTRLCVCVCVFVHLGVQAAWILVRHFAGGLWLGDYCQGPRMMIDVFDFSGSSPVHCICMHDLD